MESPLGDSNSDNQLNIGLVGSSGGHLAHLLILKPWWEDHDRFWVTFDMPDSHELLESERCDWAYHPTTRNVPNLIRNFGLAWKVLRRERPDVLISTGAAVAFPFFLLGRIMGVKTVFIEVYDRIDNARSPLACVRRCRIAFWSSGKTSSYFIHGRNLLGG